MKAQNVDVGGQRFDDSKNIVKKGIQQVQAKKKKLHKQVPHRDCHWLNQLP